MNMFVVAWVSAAMGKVIRDAAKEGRNVSHFGPEANLICDLARLFRDYGQTGNGKRRYYVHNEEEAALHFAKFDANGKKVTIKNLAPEPSC